MQKYESETTTTGAEEGIRSSLQNNKGKKRAEIDHRDQKRSEKGSEGGESFRQKRRRPLKAEGGKNGEREVCCVVPTGLIRFLIEKKIYEYRIVILYLDG